MNFCKILLGAVFGLACAAADAELNLELVGGIDSGRKIAVVPFGGQQAVSTDVARVVSDDLARTGVFAPTPSTGLRANPHRAADIKTADFEPGTEAVVVGEIAGSGNSFNVNYTVAALNGTSVKPLFGFKATVPASKIRAYAHRISDTVFERLTEIKGAFSTRIAYVRTLFGTKHPYELCVADYDGANETRLLVSSQPLMSPDWSPDGKKLAYVSFENRKAEIYVIDVATKARSKIASFTGLNGNPKWAPDGKRLAAVLSRDGNPEIYIIDVAAKKMSRVTDNGAIDTEPEWNPAGDALYFVSERGGNAQVYLYSLADGSVRKVTDRPVKNLSPAALPDGSGLITVNQSDGFTVSRQDAGGSFYALSSTKLDESPSVAPNGTMIAYSTVTGGRKGLVIISADGRSRWPMDKGRGEMSQPSWSPYLK